MYHDGVGRGSVQVNDSTDHTQNPDPNDTPGLDQDHTRDLDQTKRLENDYRTNFDPAMECAGSVKQKRRTN